MESLKDQEIERLKARVAELEKRGSPKEVWFYELDASIGTETLPLWRFSAYGPGSTVIIDLTNDQLTYLDNEVWIQIGDGYFVSNYDADRLRKELFSVQIL